MIVLFFIIIHYNTDHCRDVFMYKDVQELCTFFNFTYF